MLNNPAFQVMLEAGCGAYVGKTQCRADPTGVLTMAPEMACFVAIAMKERGFVLAAVCDAHRSKQDPPPFRDMFYQLTADMEPDLEVKLKRSAEFIAGLRKRGAHLS